MHNVMRVLARDLRRLLRVPVAWVITLGLMVLPATYAWVNIIGFWDPYGNIGGLRVSVANADEGTSSPVLGDLDLGRQVVASLKANKDLDWRFTDRAGAMDDVESGRSYAAIVIPKDFSASLGTMLTGGGTRPTLDYYVNEKASPISPKITDAAAGTVDREINDTFVSTVGDAIAGAINQAAGQLDAAGGTAVAEVSGTLDDVTDDVARVRSTIGELDATLADVPDQTKAARATLAFVRTLARQADGTLADASALLTGTRATVDDLAASASGTLAHSSGLASQAMAQATGAVGGITGALTAASERVDQSLAPLGQANATIDGILTELEGLAGPIPGLDDAIASLKHANGTLGTTLGDLTTLNRDLGATAASAGTLGTAANTAVQQTLADANTAQAQLVGTSLPQLDTGLAGLAATATTLGGRIADQAALLDQAGSVLTQLEQTAATARAALARTDDALGAVGTKLGTVVTDLTALSGANALERLVGQDHLDAKRIAEFLGSPTVLSTHTMYAVNSYGAGMAPLFTSLALWAGAFMLVVIFKLEADGEGIDGGLTPAQGYLGRWLFLALIAIGQGLVVTIGDLVIGVKAASAALFVATGVVTALVDVAITYALSTTFLHVGKALCVILIVVQIPGASGLYPIEMMPGFFRTLYPFFPFSHSIAAMRETIGGFYGGHWTHQMLVLLLYAALGFALGLGVRPWLANVNRLFARQIAQGDVIVGEPVRLRGHEFPVGEAIRVLSDRAQYREAIARRAAWFADVYPRLKRGALVAGLVVPAVLTVTFSLTTNTKLEALGAWTVWVLLVIAFLLTIEYLRDRMRRQAALGNLDDEAIRGALAQRERDRDAARRQRRERLALRRGRRHAA